MKINYFKVLVLISLVFLAYYLFKREMLVLPVIYSNTKLLLSFLFLFAGFLLQAKNWQQILRPDFLISLGQAIISSGLSIFTKYIPGKVMVVLGRAEYISNNYNYSRKIMISRSLDAQIIALWSGTLIGLLSLFWLKENQHWVNFLLVGFVLMSIFIFTPFFQRSLEVLIKKFFKRNLDIPLLILSDAVKALPVFFLYWITLSTAFYFLIDALSFSEVIYWAGFTFPLAAVMGIILLIAPGGLGVREGILTLLLHAVGIELPLATSIAIASRLWFLVGETFLFLLAISLKLFSKNSALPE